MASQRMHAADQTYAEVVAAFHGRPEACQATAYDEQVVQADAENLRKHSAS